MSDEAREPLQRINKRLTDGLDDVNERSTRGFRPSQAMMIIGFGAVGSMVRTSRRRIAFSSA